MSNIVAMFDRGSAHAKAYRAGQVVFECGTPAREVYRIQSGWVRLQVTNAEGVRSITALLGPGDTFSAFSGTNVATAECITAVTATSYDSAAMAKLQVAAPELADHLQGTEARRYAALTDHLQDLLQRTAPQRVLCLLAWISKRVRPDRFTGLTRLPMSREDMADYLNVAPATLSRIMSQFQEEGRLRLAGPRNFTLLARPPFMQHCHAAERCGACVYLRGCAQQGDSRPAYDHASATI